MYYSKGGCIEIMKRHRRIGGGGFNFLILLDLTRLVRQPVNRSQLISKLVRWSVQNQFKTNYVHLTIWQYLVKEYKLEFISVSLFNKVFMNGSAQTRAASIEDSTPKIKQKLLSFAWLKFAERSSLALDTLIPVKFSPLPPSCLLTLTGRVAHWRQQTKW